MKRLTLSPKKALLVVGAAVTASAFVALASHSVARPAKSSAASICRHSPYSADQPIVIVKVDATESTQNVSLRTQYAETLAGVAAAASAMGGYLVVDVFGADPAKTKTVCATSTRISGAAPLFVTARTAELRRVLAEVAQEASNANAGAAGSAVYGAVAHAVDRVQKMRRSRNVPAFIAVLSDGDEAADGTHLRLLLASGASNSTIVKRIIGKLPPPDARGMSIEMQGIGRMGNGQPISTTGARRMVQIWQRICSQTGARRCAATTDLLNTLPFGGDRS